jgi:hypothetical protein
MADSVAPVQQVATVEARQRPEQLAMAVTPARPEQVATAVQVGQATTTLQAPVPMVATEVPVDLPA